MIDPTDADIGRVVYYDPGYPGAKKERGVISSFNEYYVFVRYTSGITAAATLREDLSWKE